MTQEKSRYSDSELEEFKELIQRKLKEAQEDYALLVGSLSHADDHGTDDTGRTFNMMEDGSETLSREEVAQLAARQEKFIQSLQAALVRIENKTYGLCRVTGKLIQKERLMLVPHATMSIEAKNAQNK
jgi:DnaK suppressor protein